MAKWLWTIGMAVALVARPLRAAEPDGLAVAEAMQQAVIAAIARCEKSVVAIGRVDREVPGNPIFDDRIELGPRLGETVTRPGDPSYVYHDYGAGVVIDAAGLILTHYRLCESNGDLYVTTSDRKVHKAEIKAADPRSELAVLSIKGAKVTPIPLGDGSIDKLKKGQTVISLGNPYAIARDGQPTASSGIISNLRRQSYSNEIDGSAKRTFAQLGGLIQTDVKLHHGTSGGALINLRGEMIGLTTTFVTEEGVETSSGYALPVDEAFRHAVESMKTGKEVAYGLLGIGLEEEELDEGGSRGVRVKNVIVGFPADQAGIKSGVDVVTHVNGRSIDSRDQLIMEVSSHGPGERITLSVLRGQQSLPISVKLVKAYVPGEKVVTSPAPKWRGISVDYYSAVPSTSRFLTNVGGQGLGVLFGENFDPDGCVLIADVAEGSPAWQAGLRPREFLSHVDGERVSTPDEFYAAVAKQSGAVEVRIPGAQGRVQHYTVTAE